MKIKEGFVLRSVGGNNIVVPVGAQTIDFHCIITLNESGVFLWNRLQEDCDEAQLVEAVLAEYDTTEEVAAADVADFIENLRQAELLA